MANTEPPFFTQRIVVYISPEDEDEVRALCKASGMRMAAYLRTLIRHDLQARHEALAAAQAPPAVQAPVAAQPVVQAAQPA